jgi:hypothetical protein
MQEALTVSRQGARDGIVSRLQQLICPRARCRERVLLVFRVRWFAG